MINKLSEIRIRMLLRDGTPEKEIRADSVLNKYLEPFEFDILLEQEQEEQESVPESHPKPAPIEYNKVIQRSRGNDKKRNILIFKVDDDLLNRLNKYLKRNSRIIKSEVIRDALEEYLEK